MFPLEKILFALSSDSKATRYVLESIKPKIEKIRDREMELRKKVMGAGVKTTERLELQNKTGKDEEDEEYECYVCNANLYVSLIANEKEESTYCLPHGLEYIKENKNQIRHCKLLYTHTIEDIKDLLSKINQRLKSKNYIEEHDEDIPIKEEDIEDIEDDDYVDQEDLKPRNRAMPSYIKKETKPALSSESEVEDEDTEEVESEDNSPKITEDDYLGDDIDPAVIAALFAEADEVVRPSAKRKAPKERKLSESTGVSEDDEGEEEQKTAKDKPENSSKKKKDIEKSKTETRAKIKEAAKKKAQREKQSKIKPRGQQENQKSMSKSKNIEPSKSVKRKIEESPKRNKPEPKRKVSDNIPINKKASKVDDKKKPSISSSKLIPDKRKNNDTKAKAQSKREDAKEKSKKDCKDKSKSQAKDVNPKEESKRSLNSRFLKGEKASSSSKKKDSKDDKSKQRRSKKRKAKSMDAADKFNLLDIILTETDDENYCSASDRESKESSSDDEWT